MQSRTTERVLGLFAKRPSPAAVKTRLTVGGDPAWGVHVAQAFLLDAIERFTVVDTRRVLAFTPAEREKDFAVVAAGRFDLAPQADGDLGQRLNTFVQQQVDAGARAVVLVGTDS